MIPITFLVFSIFASPLALSAPASLDSNTLLQNGQAAQQLNTEFINLKVTDSCNTGDTACISGLMAQCENGAWQTQKCPGGSRECFALPSVKTNGTFIACTSESNALSLIAATGVGGLTTSNGSGNSTSPSDSGGTVTVTIILAPGSTASLPPTTTTIDPAKASSLVSNLAQGGAGSTTSIPNSGVSSSSVSVPSGSGSLSPILLTHSPSSATASAPTSSANSSYQQ